MPKTKVEVYDKDQLIYPFIESDHVTFSNGMKVSEMLDQGISMPTITHNETSFKVGVGDSDVSSSIVDSSVSKMVIKGQTYQNILPEPSTHVLTNNKEMFKVNEGLDSNVEVVDGVSKSAILKGQTKYRDEDGDIHDSFVQIPNEGNLYKGTRDFNTTYWEFGAGASPLEPFELNPNFKQATLTSNYQHLTTPTSKQGFMFDNPNKTWTISAMFKGSQEGQTIGITLDATRLEYDKKPVVNGQWTRLTWTFQGSTTLQKFRFENKSLQGTIKVAQVMVTETDHAIDWKPALQDGEYKSLELVSCKMPVLTTTGKNLATVSSVRLEGIRSNSGGHSKNIIMKNIPVEEGKTYTISGVGSKSDNMNGISFTRYEHRNPTNSNNHTQLWNEIGRDDANTTFTIPKGIKYVSFTFGNCVYNNNGEAGWLQWDDIQLEEGSSATTYEPYKSNILSTPEEVVLRSLPNGVKDTLNLMTGEYVQRIGETTFNGSEGWTLGTKEADNTLRFKMVLQANIPADNEMLTIISDNFPVLRNADIDVESVQLWGSSKDFNVRILKTKASTVDEFKSYLSQNPLTIQYPLATPVVKTVDLSSSGNWEKVVLNGSETWGVDGNYYCFCHNLQINSACAFTDSIPVLPTKTNSLPSHASFSGARYFTVLIDGILNDPVKLKQYLRQNPLTVWYQTTTILDSTQVKQPIFFKDGHIIQSSGADNSLIPTLDYQAKTSNSYVMDLMKTNTRYTMKAKSASGTFTIDGTSYGAGTNGTFTTPSSMTNKFLVMSNKTNKEVMILEEDVTDKTIPYFKGIKSAFEDEDKIEVLSIGKNIFDGSTISGVSYWADNGTVNQNGGVGNCYISYTYVNVKSSQTLYPNHTQGSVQFMEYDSNKRFIRRYNLSARNKYTVPNGVSYLRFSFYNCGDNLPQIEFNNQSTSYEPYKQNVSKIPLLSPLRSLPNGVCDELIIDRMKKKATLIQRVGYRLYDGINTTWYGEGSNSTYWGGYDSQSQNTIPSPMVGQVICDRFFVDGNNVANGEKLTVTGNKHIKFFLKQTNMPIYDKSSSFNNWLAKNPTTILYKLATPAITEVDLEGFPYIYKDGHIFLNSEIAPTMEITYSINQGQQISASNEDIIRHEKELTYLQKLIAQYVQVNYESVLLSLKI